MRCYMISANTTPSLSLRRIIFEDKREYSPTSPQSIILKGIISAKTSHVKKATQTFSTLNNQIHDSGCIHSVLIKPVSDHCNIRCTYCYEGTEKNRFYKPRMSEFTLEKIIMDALEQAKNSIEFIWHGGEPLLAGLNFFEAGIRFQEKYRNKNLQIYNSIQTNGILINDEWINFFHNNNFSLGISFDGQKSIHDKYRIDHQHNGTYSRVISTLNRLSESNIPFGIISVIHNEHIGNASQYIAEIQCRGIQYLDVHPSFGNKAEVIKPLKPKDFSDFAVDLFEAWLENGNPKIRINLFDDFLKGYFFHVPDTCYFAGTCSKIVAVEANGDVVPCTRPFDRSLYSFGNIQSSSLQSIREGSIFARFKEQDKHAQLSKNKCKWVHLCNNGCPQHRADYDGKQDISGSNFYCECNSGSPGGYAAIWNHIEARLYELFVS